MPATVRLVRQGEAALIELADAIEQAKREDRLAAVLVVVPSVRAGIQLRQRLAMARATPPFPLINVEFVLLADLAVRLSTSGDRQRRTWLSRLVLRATLAHVLERRSGRLGALAGHAGTIEELATCYETIRHARADALVVLERHGASGRELAEIFRAVHEQLAEGFVDDVDQLDAASDALERGLAPALAPVIVHLPLRLRRGEVRLIAALATRTEVGVHLGVTAGRDVPVATMCERLVRAGCDLVGPVPSEAEPIEIELFAAADPRTEVRHAIEVVLEELALGAHSDELAICVAASSYREPLLRLARDVGLELHGAGSATLAASPPARLLLSFFELAVRGPSRQRLLAMFRAAPLRAALGIDLGEWDRVSRRAGIIEADLETWRAQLAALASETPAYDDGESGSEESRRSREARRTRETCAVMRAVLDDLELELEAAHAITSYGGGAAVAHNVLEHYLAETSDEADPAEVSVARLLDELGDLGRTNGRCDLGGFQRALAQGLERPGPRLGERGRGILLGRLEDVAGMALRTVVVIGAIEGNVPATDPRGALVDRATSEELEIEEATPTERLGRERYRLFSALMSARRAVVSVARCDPASGRLLLASRFLAETDTLDFAPRTDGLVSETEHRAALLAEARAAGAVLEEHFLARGEAELARPLLAAARREAQRFDEFAGRIVARELVDGVGGRVFSPTTLETFAACPFRYFVSHELAVEVLEAPESRLSIDPRERGSLVHEILERFVRACIAQPTMTNEEEIALLGAIAATEFASCERRGLVGKALLWEREKRQILRLLERERERDRARRTAGRRPIVLEHGFGINGEPPVEVAVGDRRLAFRGLVDRIDRDVDGTLAVVDYKTGRMDEYRGIAADPVDRGRHLQLPLYALAAGAPVVNPDGAPVSSAAYRFLDVNGREIEVRLDESTRTRFVATLGVLAETIEQGCFPVHPGPLEWRGPHNCAYCDFDALCRSDRVEHFAAIAALPELASYVALAEGDDVDE